MKGATYFALLLLSSTLLFSCKTSEKEAYTGPLPSLTAAEILSKSAVNRNFGELSAKVSISYAKGTEKQTVSAKVRMKQDSIIWVSVAPIFGIELIRAVITPDSLMLLDRFNKRYYKGDFDRINQMLKTELNFAMLQALLTGNTIELYEAERYQSRSESNRYIIDVAARSKKELKKGALPPRINQQSWIEPQHFSVTRGLIHDTSSEYKMDATYSDLRAVGAIHFPQTMSFQIAGKEPMKVDLQWSNTEFTSGQEFPFSVPDKYEPIK
jgi:hypothetical protein